MTSLHDRPAWLREAVVPGWLAEAMPYWLTEAVRPKPAPVPWGAMVRAALAICVPLSVGIAVGRRDIGLVLAIGGLTGAVIDTGGPYLVRVKRAVIAGVLADASAVDILLGQAGGTLTVQVRDGADASRGSGLTGLRDRVEAVGGSMTVDSPAGAGTVLTVLLPVTEDDH
jgi:hypothetical protein